MQSHVLSVSDLTYEARFYALIGLALVNTAL